MLVPVGPQNRLHLRCRKRGPPRKVPFPFLFHHPCRGGHSTPSKREGRGGGFKLVLKLPTNVPCWFARTPSLLPLTCAFICTLEGKVCGCHWVRSFVLSGFNRWHDLLQRKLDVAIANRQRSVCEEKGLKIKVFIGLGMDVGSECLLIASLGTWVLPSVFIVECSVVICIWECGLGFFLMYVFMVFPALWSSPNYIPCEYKGPREYTMCNKVDIEPPWTLFVLICLESGHLDLLW